MNLPSPRKNITRLKNPSLTRYLWAVDVPGAPGPEAEPAHALGAAGAVAVGAATDLLQNGRAGQQFRNLDM